MAPSVAFFTDSYHEINGVARTSRKFEEFARKTNRRFLYVHGTSLEEPNEPGNRLPLRRGLTSFHLERDLQFDPTLWRYAGTALNAVSKFGADVIHVTSPGDVGLLGAYVAHRLAIPLVASWHTNVHEYAKCRLEKLLRFLPRGLERPVAESAEIQALRVVVRFYKFADVILAPNFELLRMLESETKKPVFLMHRGVDTDQFSPRKRTRQENRVFRIGFVGRLAPEKNVQFLARLERGLAEKGFDNFSIVVVGDGSERRWLERNLTRAEFTGVLLNDALAEAYANMDLFAFPSQTDTYGNVILEALASGVPPIVMDGGGPKYLVEHGISGFISKNEAEFIEFASRLMSSPNEHRRIREQARDAALKLSWDSVFEEVYRAYETAINRNHKEVA